MARDRPGFFTEAILVWLTTVVCIVATIALDMGLNLTDAEAALVGIVLSAFVVFLFLLSYYRLVLGQSLLSGRDDPIGALR